MVPQLLTLTEKSLTSVLLEPFVLRSSRALGIGQAADTLDTPLPNDKVLVLGNMASVLNAEAGTTWADFSVQWLQSTSGAQIVDVWGDLFTAGAGAGLKRNWQHAGLWLPPGGILRITTTRTGTTGATSAVWSVLGWVIPRGNAARAS